jgi:hypothetical protein
MTVRERARARGLLVAGTLGVAVLLAAGIAIVYLATGGHADAPRPNVEGDAAASRAEGTPPAASPGAGRAELQVVARAPPPASAKDSPGGAPRAPPPPPIPRAASGIKISFKLDPRLTRSLHMGTRWVSPPSYVASQGGNLYTVQARADGVAAGRGIRDPTWLASEPDMVAVTPDRGREVEIAVLREGRSTLTVEEGGVHRTVTVTAVHRSGVWEVDISR